MTKKIKLGYVTIDEYNELWIPWRNEDETVTFVPLAALYDVMHREPDDNYTFSSMNVIRAALTDDGDEILDERVTGFKLHPVKEFKRGKLYVSPTLQGFYTLISDRFGRDTLYPIRSQSRKVNWLNVRTDLDNVMERFAEVEIND